MTIRTWSGFRWQMGINMQINRLVVSVLSIITSITASSIGMATDYHIGPGQEFESPFEAPWHRLLPGDTVFIHWREKSYRNKWVLVGHGTAAQPITVKGVPGPNGELPLIDGESATTPPGLDFWSEQRAVIKIGGANVPDVEFPTHIVVENLDIRAAHPYHMYLGSEGLKAYSEAASAIYVESGSNITIRNCIMRDCANGFFSAYQSRDVLVEGCYIHTNGMPGTYYQHNSYTAGRGVTYQFNRFGPLREDCLGNALKDRSAGLIVRYNWIEGGNRQLDLVEGDDSMEIVDDPRYGQTFVYCNVLIEHEGDGNNQMLHYGGDNGNEPDYRKGVLYFLNNTVISHRTDRTVLARLSTNEETAVVTGNVFYTSAPGSHLAILDESGLVRMTGNWIRKGWKSSHEDGFEGRVIASRNVEGESPRFVDFNGQDFRPVVDSPCIDAGAPLIIDEEHEITLDWEFAMPRGARARKLIGAIDLGAFEARATTERIQ
ncbi:MAG: polysaccharide-degrading enzyme [Planctomycetaceae bacterium]|nr:polysaccharide-degrading enzyme [Planctomycetaceae bacterium]